MGEKIGDEILSNKTNSSFCGSEKKNPLSSLDPTKID